MRVFAIFTITAAAVAGWWAGQASAAELLGTSGPKLAAEELRVKNEDRMSTSPLMDGMKLSKIGKKAAGFQGEGEAWGLESLRADKEDQPVDPLRKKEESRRPTYPPRSVGYYLQRRAQKRKKKNSEGGKKNGRPLAKRAPGISGEQ